MTPKRIVVSKIPSLKKYTVKVLLSNQNDLHFTEMISECIEYMCLSFEESPGSKML